ncbi:TolC family protein, partial [candidate division WOR-3 bacterium]|nr:TolC family protein [candidate division WOR-3 bacterium]
GWAVSAVLSWNLFNGGKSYADIKTAKSRLEQIRIAKRQLKDGLDMGLHSLVNSYNKAIEDINAQKLNVEKAKEGLDIAKTQYEQGVITNTNYLDAEVGLMQANLNLLQAEYSAISNYYQIQYLTGNVNF